MAISDYIDTLKKTKTYQAGLIKFEECSMKLEYFGFKRTLDVPHADNDRHIIVMEIRGNQPTIRSILTQQNPSISLTSKDEGKLLFIFIEMRPQPPLKIETPAEGYRLGDGDQINSTFTVNYQVVDAEAFWKGGKDPLADFEAIIINAAKNFFLKVTGDFLINNPANSKKQLEQHVEQNLQETIIKIVKNDLESSIQQNCEIPGIKIVRVNADLQLSDLLKEHLERIRKVLYNLGGVADRWKIDQLLERDPTFHPYNLLQVIMALDIRLRENFYTMDWRDAMRKVTEELTDRKEKYHTSVKEAKINERIKRIKIAREYRLDEIVIKELEDDLAEELKKGTNTGSDEEVLSDSKYLKKLIPLSAPLVNEQPEIKGQQTQLGNDEGKIL